MKNYKCLSNSEYKFENYCLVPIRFEDRFDIMRWRNEQIYHLRQTTPLTKELQNNYFNTIITQLFEEDYPNQILFSFLNNGKCIGYGGLVHINWIDRHAEISFIMETKVDKYFFELHWNIYISLLEIIAFKDLKLHKIFTYAFDLRPRLYPIFEKAGYEKEAQLKDHHFYNDKYVDVVIHSKILQ